MDERRTYGKNKSGSFRKRTYDQFDNGKRKKHNSGRDHGSTTTKPIDTIYRILCPVKKIGSVLGKGGDIVNTLRDETHAKIRVADAIPGAEERVIIIFSYLSQSEKNDSDQDLDDSDGNELEDMQPHCPAQDALLKIHDRIAADEILRGGVVQSKTEPDDVVTARILVPKNQVGCLLGKGGTIIQQLRSETGANIRVLPSDHLPPCAMDSDELVQVSGVPSIVKKALYRISTLLHQHPHKENPPLEDLIYASTQGSYHSEPSVPPPLPQGNRVWSQYHSDAHVPPTIPRFSRYLDEPSGYPPSNYGRSNFGNDGETVEEFSIRILCATVKIGGVIGKGGVNVRQLEQQTGAHIQVEDTAPEAEERVISISCKEVPWDTISPTIEAVLQLQSRTSASSENGVITTRLLVPSSKVGCILGQGGNIITEMRRRTKADIRVYSKDDKPKYTSANEELVQISGTRDVARDALAEIASRLRARTFRGGNAAVNPAPSAPFHGIPPLESRSDRGVPSYGNAALDYAPPSHFRGYTPESFSAREIPTSSMVGPGKSVGYSYPKGYGQAHEAQYYSTPSAAPGFSHLSRYSNFNSSMDVKIPNSAVAPVIGADGSNISDIHQVGGRLKLHDPPFGAPERVDMHGSSDQLKVGHGPLPSYMTSGGQSFPPSQASGIHKARLPVRRHCPISSVFPCRHSTVQRKVRCDLGEIHMNGRDPHRRERGREKLFHRGSRFNRKQFPDQTGCSILGTLVSFPRSFLPDKDLMILAALYTNRNCRSKLGHIVLLLGQVIRSLHQFLASDPWWSQVVALLKSHIKLGPPPPSPCTSIAPISFCRRCQPYLERRCHPAFLR